MKKALLFTVLFLMAAGVARAEFVESYKDSSCQGTCGTKLSAKAGNVPAWTGWIYTGKARAAIFDVTFVDNGAGDGSAITMRCESSSLNTTPADAGFDLHGAVVSCVSPACTCTTSTYPNTWTTPTPGAATTVRWSWTVDNVPAPFLNCYFAITGGAAAETYTVAVRGVSP
jgi:hypothetical protein